MFKIKSYLQFRNTPDGKPRVLTEGVHYEYSGDGHLFKDFRAVENYTELVNLSDCRPLLTVEIDGVEWTEGDIFEQAGKTKYRFLFSDLEFCSIVTKFKFIMPKTQTISSFFDNPAKYSKLLWNCSEKRGWEKVLKLIKW